MCIRNIWGDDNQFCNIMKFFDQRTNNLLIGIYCVYVNIADGKTNYVIPICMEPDQ